MPLPKPRKKEDKNEFISRCMSDDIMRKEYKDNKQRVAVCLTQFQNIEKSKKAKLVGMMFAKGIF